ncbi:hypothetical protein, partial [Tateyamaria sp.]|uniref:hypothetical protein n=1 Tax=Tateyamaria sp. TaxID=1929288 RepID=UPI00329D1BC4
AAKPRQTDIWAEMSQFRHAVQTVLPASDDKVATLSQIFGGNSYDVTITDLSNGQYSVKREGATDANRDTVSFDMTFTINEAAQ